MTRITLTIAYIWTALVASTVFGVAFVFVWWVLCLLWGA